LAPRSIAVVCTLLGLGNAAWQQGDLPVAENYFRQALTIENENRRPNLGRAVALVGISLVAWYRGQRTIAEYYNQDALITQRKDNRNSLDVARTLNNLSILAQESGNLWRAERYVREALSIAKTRAPESIDLATASSGLADILLERGHPKQALNYYLRALTIEERVAPSSLYMGDTLYGMGNLYRKLARSQEAEEYYRHALLVWEKGTSLKSYRAGILAALAGLLRGKGQAADAALLYKQGLDILESQSARLGGGSDAHSSFLAKHQDIYRQYADLLVQLGSVDQAFDVLERSRARSLAEALASSHLDIRKGVDPSLLEQERSLGQKFTAKSNYRIHLLSQSHSEEQIKALDKEISELLIQYQDVEGQIRSSSPGYAALTQPEALNGRQIQERLLDEDTVLLEYSLGEERSYLFVVTPTTLKSYQLPSRKEIERGARRLYTLLRVRNHGVRGESREQKRVRLRSVEAAYSQAAAQLSRMVLGPAAAELRGKRLLVVSDGALAFIPFSILPTQTADSGKSEPLIAEHEIVNLPSASVLALLRQQEQGRQPAPKAVAVLADPVFSERDPRVSQASAPASGASLKVAVNRSAAAQTDDSLDHALRAHLLQRSAGDVGQLHLNRLPYTRQEAAAIAGVAAADERMEALDFRASRRTAMSAELEQYRIVHFATHGLLDSRNPELSGLVLSLVDEEGRPQDGFLQLQDVYNMNLGADLVVLSACETGLGQQVEGEGLVGLTRGFMYAGATRVVASLWRVDDEATAELMKKFYEGMLREGKRPAEALREAQQWMRTQKGWEAPYYWAGFVLHGEWK